MECLLVSRDLADTELDNQIWYSASIGEEKAGCIIATVSKKKKTSTGFMFLENTSVLYGMKWSLWLE